MPPLPGRVVCCGKVARRSDTPRRHPNALAFSAHSGYRICCALFDGSWLSRLSNGCSAPAQENGKVVAQLMITLEWSDWRNGEVWWIQSVFVRADHRRQVRAS